jgi:hypothetical protein
VSAPDDAQWTIPPVEPTDDPEWYRLVTPCDHDQPNHTCHHPVHAFGHPEGMRHLVDTHTAEFAIEQGWIE